MEVLYEKASALEVTLYARGLILPANDTRHSQVQHQILCQLDNRASNLLSVTGHISDKIKLEMGREGSMWATYLRIDLARAGGRFCHIIDHKKLVAARKTLTVVSLLSWLDEERRDLTVDLDGRSASIVTFIRPTL